MRDLASHRSVRLRATKFMSADHNFRQTSILDKILMIVGLVGFILYLLNYYYIYCIPLIILLVLTRNVEIPISKRVYLNVASAILAPVYMIYPMLKHGIVFNKNLEYFIICTIIFTLIFSRPHLGYISAWPLFLGFIANAALYLRISPTIALPVTYAVTFVYYDVLGTIYYLRKTPENIVFVIGGDGIFDGLITLPGTVFIFIILLILQILTSGIVPAPYLYIKQGKYS